MRTTLNRRDWLRRGIGGTLAVGGASFLRAGDEPPRPPEPTGRIYLYAHLRIAEGEDLRGLFAIDAANGAWTKVADIEDGNARVSPDGKLVASTEHRVDDGYAIPIATKVVPLDGGEPRQVADFGGLPLWSPDGKALMISRALKTPRDPGETWQFEHWLVPIDGPERTKLPFREDDEIDDWSADGRWVVSVSSAELKRGGYQLDVLRPDGTDRRRVTDGPGTNVCPRLSPDGRRVAYYHGERGKSAIRVVDRDSIGTRDVVPAHDLARPEYVAWSPDGSQLAATMMDWTRDERGEVVIGRREDANIRLVIAPVDGSAAPRPISLPTTLFLGHPQWLAR